MNQNIPFNFSMVVFLWFHTIHFCSYYYVIGDKSSSKSPVPNQQTSPQPINAVDLGKNTINVKIENQWSQRSSYKGHWSRDKRFGSLINFNEQLNIIMNPEH